MSNFYANIGKNPQGLRDTDDQYETPKSITEALCRHVQFAGEILEPACGTGRISRVLTEDYSVTSEDIQDGQDFLERSSWDGSIVTNPPYKNGLAEVFVRHALSLTEEPVAMLVRLGFLTSQGRCPLYHKHPPSTILFVTPRIRFYYRDGTRIPGQAHDHCWVVWNEPEHRPPIWLTPEECYDASRDQLG